MTHRACHGNKEPLCQGVFWDAEGGCLAGEWRDGVLAGAARYERPTMTLSADFAAGLPRGEARFVRRVAAAAGAAPIAAAHLLAGGAVALAHGGRYEWPAGEGLGVYMSISMVVSHA